MKKTITLNDMMDSITKHTSLTVEEIMKLEHNDFLDLYEKVIDMVRAQNEVRLKEITFKAKVGR